MLQQSVLKHIPRRGDGVWEGAAIGFDAAIFQNGDITEVQAVGAMPTCRVPEGYPLTAGELAWITAENQLAVKGVFGREDTPTGNDREPVMRNAAGEESHSGREVVARVENHCGREVAAQILLVAGMSCPEKVIRSQMQRLAQFAAQRGCPIVGGNTVHFQEGEDLLVQVVLTANRGQSDAPAVTAKEKASNVPATMPKAKDRVYFLGEAGALGADLLVKAHRDSLRERFSDSYIETMEYISEKERAISPGETGTAGISSTEHAAEAFLVKNKAIAALEAGAVFLHDVSNGGVHAALYQLAEAAGCGIHVRHEGLTIRQSVIELSEALNINPYLLLGTGGLLAVVPEEAAELFERTMKKRSSFPWSYAGHLTKEKARVITAENFHMERYLNLPEGDAIDDVIRKAKQ